MCCSAKEWQYCNDSRYRMLTPMKGLYHAFDQFTLLGHVASFEQPALVRKKVGGLVSNKS